MRRGTEPADYDSFGLVKYHYLADQKATGGDYGLYRVDIAPNGGGPGPHFHRAISEAFFVLSGTVRLYDGADWFDGLGDLTDEERREWFIRNDNFFIE